MKTKRIISGLLSVLLCLSLVIGMVPLIPAVSAAENVTSTGRCSNHDHSDTETWKSFNDAYQETDATLLNTARPELGTRKIITTGHYYLKADLEVDTRIDFNGTVHLCLNGYAIKGKPNNADAAGKSNLIVINGNVTLCDCNSSGHNGGQITVADGVDSTVYQGLVNVGSGSSHMYGGKICGNNTNQNGGGVRVNGGTFTMHSGWITDNTTSGSMGGGGVYVGATATFVMKGGTISNNNASNSYMYGGGGGISVYSTKTVEGQEAKAIINGGTISNNTAYYGAAICLISSAELELNGGTISNNVATTSGGAINLVQQNNNLGNKPEMVMNDGEISQNTVTNSTTSNCGGGAISIQAGTVTINDGAITGNKNTTTTAAYSAGGAVYMCNSSDLIINGGVISANEAVNDGGAIYVADGGSSVTMSGGEIINNTLTNNNCGGVKINVAGAQFIMTGGVMKGNKGDDLRMLNGSATISGSSQVQLVRAWAGASVTIKDLKAGANIVTDAWTGTYSDIFTATGNTYVFDESSLVYTYNLGLDTQARMVLGSSLNIQFKLPHALANEKVTANVDFEQDGEILTVYRNPAQMAEDITLNIGAYTYTCSVQDYAERLIAKEGTTEVLKNVLIDMLNYGDAAQKAYDTYGPAMTLGDYADDSGTTLPDDYYKNAKGQARLILSDGIAMRVKVENAAEGTAATYAFTSFDDEEYTVNTTVQQESDGTCYVLVDRICMADAFNKVTVTVGEETIEDSVAAYCDRQEDEMLVNLCDALLKFAAAAQAYLPTVA